MINLKTFSENGGFYVEFNGVFLGAGQAELELQGQTHEMRRDNLHLLRQRILRNMTLKVKVRLAAGDRFWELLCANAGQAEKLCCAGGSLRLYPADSVRRGYAFEQVFLENAAHLAGAEESDNSLKLVFAAESDGKSWKMIRLDAGALPPGVPEKTPLSIGYITRNVMDFLKQELHAVPGQTLCLNFPAPEQGGGYLLKLQKCSNFHWQGPRKLDYTLNAVFPAAEKNKVDAAMAELAEKLNGFCLAESDPVLYSRVKTLDLSRMKSSNGSIMTDSMLEFSLLAE